MRNYEKPIAKKIEFFYGEVITTSGGGNNCYWKNDGYWSHGTQTCHDTYNEGTATQVPA